MDTQQVVPPYSVSSAHCAHNRLKVLIGSQPQMMHGVHSGEMIRLLMAVALLAAAHTSLGADVLLVKPDPALALRENFHIRTRPHLLIRGEILAADVKQVRDLMPQLRKAIPSSALPLVLLHSPGGDLIAAMQIGATFRQATAWIAIDSGAECISACIFILAAGVQRWVLDGSRLGIHRPYFDSRFFAKLDANAAASRYDELARRSREYLKSMGMEDQLFADMLGIPSNRVRTIDRAYGERVRLIGIDPGFEEWVRARKREQHGEQYLRQEDLYLECLNSGASFPECGARFPLRSTKPGFR